MNYDRYLVFRYVIWQHWPSCVLPRDDMSVVIDHPTKWRRLRVVAVAKLGWFPQLCQ